MYSIHDKNNDDELSSPR